MMNLAIFNFIRTTERQKTEEKCETFSLLHKFHWIDIEWVAAQQILRSVYIFTVYTLEWKMGSESHGKRKKQKQKSRLFLPFSPYWLKKYFESSRHGDFRMKMILWLATNGM